jgi:predicted kinase
MRARRQCEEARFKRVNKDDLRRMIDNEKFSKDNERVIEAARDALLMEFIQRGCDVIIDDTNFDPRHEERIREVAGGPQVDIEVKYFDVPLHECLARNALRTETEGKVPAHVIKNMHRKWVHSEIYTYVVQDEELPRCTIFDIDGTLALPAHRGVYEHEKCDTDEVNWPVADMLHSARERGDRIVFLSGRSNAHRDMTQAWLIHHGLLCPRDEVFMRAADDNRDDAIIKRELYETHVKPDFFVRCIFDDRDKVVRMWRELGLPCFQVRAGDF